MRKSLCFELNEYLCMPNVSCLLLVRPVTLLWRCAQQFPKSGDTVIALPLRAERKAERSNVGHSTCIYNQRFPLMVFDNEAERGACIASSDGSALFSFMPFSRPPSLENAIKSSSLSSSAGLFPLPLALAYIFRRFEHVAMVRSARAAAAQARKSNE